MLQIVYPVADDNFYRLDHSCRADTWYPSRLLQLLT